MKLTKCEKGHFYDGDKYPECPYCNTELQKDAGTIVKQAAAEGDPAAPAAQTGTPSGPVAGWLVVMEGKAKGADFRLGQGRSCFGTEVDGTPCPLSADAPLSARLLTIAYDAADGSFTAVPGSGQALCYINGKANLAQQALKAGDVITLGEAALTFVPFCGKFRWEADAPAKAPAPKATVVPVEVKAPAKAAPKAAEKPAEKPEVKAPSKPAEKPAAKAPAKPEAKKPAAKPAAKTAAKK